MTTVDSPRNASPSSWNGACAPRSTARPSPSPRPPGRSRANRSRGAGGYALNLPLRARSGRADTAPPVAVDHPDVVVESVKLADDRSGDVVVRRYESRGGTARAALTASYGPVVALDADLLEEPGAALPAAPDGAVPLRLRPFEIRAIRLRAPH
ncbi:glycosyl hydrolase-related protein [Streptomyces sp. PSRA5]|uniref:glycosyl hydrolase-related protein n=1 Tax=Streptomyces panacea TaxID=3035064 RepID=UPI00339CB499